VNGYIKDRVMPLETLRAEKDLLIRTLQQRICRFEQTMRMTSAEADQVELNSVSEKIFEAVARLQTTKSECAVVADRFAVIQKNLSQITAERDAVLSTLHEAKNEIEVLAEERVLIDNLRYVLAEERALTVQCREEMVRFQDGRMGASFREKKAQLEALQREMEGLRMERHVGVSEPSFVNVNNGDGMDAEMAAGDAVETGKKKSKIASNFDFVRETGVRMLCRCGERVPLTQVEAHATEVHSVGSRKILICNAGCGFFVINCSHGEISRHTNSSSCSQRLAQINELLSGN
jgi:hypothetical protein